MIDPVNSIARDWAVKYAGNRWNISDALRAEIRHIVVRGFSGETRMRDLIEEIRAAGDFSVGLATVIAETEIADAQVGGNWEVWKKSGLVRKVKWLSSSLGPCAFCEMNAGSIVAFGSPFPSGALRPPQHLSCRCSIVAVEIG